MGACLQRMALRVTCSLAKHVRSLELVGYFESKDFPALAYYCALREHFSADKDMHACLNSSKFEYGGFKVFDPHGDLFDKYANRGASAVLDFLVYVGQK